MKNQITSDNIDLSPSMFKLAEEKLAKLESRVSNVKEELRVFRVVMNTAPNETFAVKIEAVIHGKKYFAEKTSYTLESALVQSVEEVDRMLEREQDKSNSWNKKESKKGLMLQKMSPDNKVTKPKKELLISLIMSMLFLTLCTILLGYYYYKNLFPFSVVSVQAAGRNQARVEIKSVIPLKTKIKYGTSDIYFNETELSQDYSENKEAWVAGLLPDKGHYFRVVGIDQNGKEYTSKFYIL